MDRGYSMIGFALTVLTLCSSELGSSTHVGCSGSVVQRRVLEGWSTLSVIEIPAAYLVRSQKRYAQNNIVAFAFFSSRIPILLLYYRVFGVKPSVRYAIYFAFFADALVYLCNVPLLAIFCAPPPGGLWSAVFQKCQRLTPLAIAQGTCNIALDIYILGLPLKPVLDLKLTIRRKIGVLTIFCSGLL